MKRNFRVLIAFSCLFGLALIPENALAATPQSVRPAENGEGALDLGEKLSQCFAANRKLAVLFLVDESKSLARNDPFGLRVIPIDAIANLFSSLAENEESPVDVTVSMYGFGGGFVERQPWVGLDKSSLDEFSQVVRNQGKFNGDSYTRYHVALSGAIKAFDSDPNGQDSCRMMFWFSDGEHDNDDDSGLSDTEIGQIKGQVCNSGGYADQLREKNIQMWALGLNADQNQTELMRLIASNDGNYKSGKLQLATGSCGSLEALGTYSGALDTSQLGQIIENLPGVPKVSIPAEDCGSEVKQCAQVNFTADSSLSGFNVLASRSSPSTSVDLILPSGEPLSVFDAGSNRPKGIRIVTTSENSSILFIRRPPAGTLAGDWSIRYLGPDAKESKSKISFEAAATVELTDDQGKTVETIDRWKPKALRISVVNGKAFVTDLQVSLSDSEKAVSIMASTKSATEFAINPKDLKKFLGLPPLDTALGAKLLIQPSGFVPGLKDIEGNPVPITFSAVTAGFGITNGADYPAYIPGDEIGLLPINDTDEVRIRLKFRGPDAVDGVVKVLGIDQGPDEKEFKIVGDKECVIPASTEAFCEFTLAPAENGYGKFTVPVDLTLNSKQAEKVQEQTLQFDVFLTRSPNVGKGVRDAFLLFFLFLLIQFLIRAGSAVAMSRFQALGPTARKIRIPILVNSDGSIMSTGRGGIEASSTGSPDNSFAIEVGEPQSNFELFGYEFGSSAVAIFFSPMSQELKGKVSHGGNHVFGSRSTQLPSAKNLNTEMASGGVSLTLRKQWVIGLSPAAISSLVSGETTVEGELVAIMDPYEMSPVETQISDLTTDIAVSTFPTRLQELVDRVRESQQSGSDEEDVSVNPISQEADPFGGAFGENSSAGAFFDSAVEKPNRGKREKRRGSKNQENDFEDNLIPETDSDDPFR